MGHIASRSFSSLALVAKSLLFQPLALAIIFIGTVAFVGPWGDFPLNDDWSFAISTRALVTTGSWKPIGWTGMTLITNALWAAPVCSASHCSFDDLRLTTLLASLLLLSATFFLVRLNSKGTIEPIVAALLVAFNPIAYATSFTFMTEILFSTLVTVSTLLYIASLKRDSVLLAVLGTIVALAAILSRQLGLCLPLAYLIVRLLPAGESSHKTALCTVPLIVCAASLLLFNEWLRATGRSPGNYNAELEGIAVFLRSPLWEILSRLYYNTIIVLLYLGLFSVPILLVTTRPTVGTGVQSSARRIPFVVAVAAVVLAIIGMIRKHQIMPMLGNILIDQGIGPLTLRDTYILGLDNVPALPFLFWIVVTLLSLWGMFELTGRVVAYAVNIVSRRGRFESGELGAPFAGIAVLTYFAPPMLLHYDRYLIPALPLTLFFLASISAGRPVRRHRAATAGVLCVLTAIFAVLGTHDYMAWNRARWTAITDLQKAGIAGPADLDGGFEYNGLYSYDYRYHPSGEKSWWWVNKDDYQITFGPIEGLKIIRQYAYETWLPPAKRFILVLSK